MARVHLDAPSIRHDRLWPPLVVAMAQALVILHTSLSYVVFARAPAYRLQDCRPRRLERLQARLQPLRRLVFRRQPTLGVADLALQAPDLRGLRI